MLTRNVMVSMETRRSSGCFTRTVYTFVPLFFPWDFPDSYVSIELPPSWFVKASATWGECLNYRGEREWGGGSSRTQRTLTRVPLGSLGTLPRLHSPIQATFEAYESRKFHGKIGDCEQSTALSLIAFVERALCAVPGLTLRLSVVRSRA